MEATLKELKRLDEKLTRIGAICSDAGSGYKSTTQVSIYRSYYYLL